MVKNWGITFITVFLFFFSLPTIGQEDEWAVFAEMFMEDMTTEEDGTTATNALYEELMELHRNPMDINLARKADLMRMPFLTEQQADSILCLIERSHGLLSMGELMFVKNLQHRERRFLSLFFYCSHDPVSHSRHGMPDSLNTRPDLPTTRRNVSQGLRTDVSMTMSAPLYRREGFRPHSREELERNPNCQYLGNSTASTLRYRASWNNCLLWGLTAQKDEGEPFAAKGNSLFDSYSVFVMGKGERAVRKWIIGDYTAHFGLGLTVGSSGADAMGVLASMSPRQAGFTAHTATDEAMFMRGGAIDVRLGRVSIRAFGSWRKHDATLMDDSISTIITNGYHRTPLEMDKRHNVAALQGGVSVGAMVGAFHMGVNAVHTHYDKSYRRPTALYRKYYFQGSDFGNYSVEYSMGRGAFKVWGETATSEQGGVATLHRVQYAPHHKLALNVLHRYYSKRYLATSAQSYRVGSRIQNEHGLMAGFCWEPVKLWELKGYVDVAHFPTAVYASKNPKNALGAMLQAEYSPLNTTTWLLRYKYRSMPDDNSAGLPDCRVQHTLKGQWRYSGRVWNLATTADMVFLSQPDKGTKCGWMVSQRASVVISRATRLSMSGAVFHTDSYAEGLRLYEPILLYSSGYPICYYHGSRLSVSAQHTVGPLSVAVKYALTHYSNRDSIGTGLRMYHGSTLQEVFIQVALRV